MVKSINFFLEFISKLARNFSKLALVQRLLLQNEGLELAHFGFFFFQRHRLQVLHFLSEQIGTSLDELL